MGRRYYRKGRRTPIDPIFDLATRMLAIVLSVIFSCCIFWSFSQPNAFKFSFGASPTPTASPSTVGASSGGLEVIGLFGICAILIGAGGLVILGIIWLAWNHLKQPTGNQTSAKVTGAVSQSISTIPTVSDEGMPIVVTSHPIIPTAQLAPTPNEPALNVETTSTVTKANPVDGIKTGGSPKISKPLTIMSASPIWQSESPKTESDVDAQSVMSRFERGFFWTLRKAIREDYYIFPQVPLRQLANQAQTRWLDRDLKGMLNMGVVDFLLINPTTLEATVAFEFDDPSHRQADAQARDRRKGRVIEHVGIPLIRFRSGEKWNPDAVRRQIQESVASNRTISFLNDSECTAFKLLRQAREDLYIFPKIPLDQIIRRKNWLPQDTLITLKNDSVDFLLAHPKYLGTLLVVSLAQLEYSEKGNLLNKARIPWISFRGGTYPAVSELRDKIGHMLPKWQ